jgi:hypothetical protein
MAGLARAFKVCKGFINNYMLYVIKMFSMDSFLAPAALLLANKAMKSDAH